MQLGIEEWLDPHASPAGRLGAGRRARREAMLLAVVVAVLTWTTIVTPATVRGRSSATADMSVTPVALFFTAAGLYLVYAFTAALCWTWRYARMSQRPLSTGLWLTAASLACMIAANSLRVAGNVVRWSGGTLPQALPRGAALLLAVAVPLFVVGVSFSSVVTRLAALRVWRQHRRDYRRMRPLWVTLHSAFPEAALYQSVPAAWQEVLHIRGIHRRYYRRVIECRDGLVRISPHLAKMGVGEGVPPEAVAERLPSALRAHAAGESVGSCAIGVALPVEDNLDADARQLVAVSQALGSS
ncbi:MAB_1171c family putative transporter [Streptomyces sp. NPDC052036]|uniref:MAB_1171c family putative transporter n=1 Tax=unclassified Streptomyces TaxID=2593676 RepID=UPI0034486E41